MLQLPLAVRVLQITASNVQPLLPHMLWTLQPASLAHSSNSTEHRLQHLWELLSTVLGCQAQVDPHVAMSMLLSAAAVGGREKQQPGTVEQVSGLAPNPEWAVSTICIMLQTQPVACASPPHDDPTMVGGWQPWGGVAAVGKTVVCHPCTRLVAAMHTIESTVSGMVIDTGLCCCR